MDEDRLRRIAHELSNRVKTPSPKVILKESSSPVTSSTGWLGAGKITMPSGYMDLSPPDGEIEAVLAHELVHIRERHQLETLPLLAFPSLLLTALFWVLTSSSIIFVPLFGLISLVLLCPILLPIIMRHWERRADEGAARLTDPNALIQALERLEPHQTFWGRILHRSVEKRVAHLNKRFGAAPQTK